MKAHVIENNLVVNSIEVDSLSDFPNLVDGYTGGIGWHYLNGVLIAPPVTPRTDDELAADARTERDNLLAATYWTASSDVTMSPAMTTYRQALRDLPTQAGFPGDITWPVKP